MLLSFLYVPDCYLLGDRHVVVLFIVVVVTVLVRCAACVPRIAFRTGFDAAVDRVVQVRDILRFCWGDVPHMYVSVAEPL